MKQAPGTVRSADWPAPTKMTLALIAKDIGKSSSYFASLASAPVNKERRTLWQACPREYNGARGCSSRLWHARA